ncbi:phage tail protein [Parasphingorhabdus sp.]|uniref:phage tail protein n=1 Tax=Parasphingorhabdus sp. TaxID=2709688 RepID=UPI003A8E3D04
MATLVLTAVGSAVGGPIGGAIGAIIGQQVDQNILFEPKGREGPRLPELAVQTSSYGAQIPRLFGKMRVAGTVIWATDLKETRSRQGGGKGRPSTTVYSYSACFAVALSCRRIRDIGRIWADGKIFRGAAGDFKTETQFSFHAGCEDQLVDGLMASAEAAGGTPAYRGYGLAVFGDMDLAEYGNRIPSLTFEVMADDGSIMIADIIADISGQRIALSAGEAVIGFAAGGEDRQAALRSLTDSIPLSFSSDPDAIDHIAAEVRAGADIATALTIDSDVVHAAGNQEIAPLKQHTASAAAAPRQMSVRYYDPARDYQAGIQSAFRPGTGRLAHVREFPAAITADGAKTIARSALWSEYDGRSTLSFSVPLRGTIYRPGMLTKFEAFPGLWRIRQCEMRSGFVQLSLTRARAIRGLTLVGSEEGRIIADSDLRAGVTRLVLVDLPFALDAPAAVSDSARLYAAAAGDIGWRNAQLFASGSDGTPGEYIGQIPAPTIMGVASAALGSANAALVDRLNHIDVDLQHSAMALRHADDPQLLAGSNIAMIGQEIIQFGKALSLGNGRYRLSRLLRGLGGTEAEITRHSVGEAFVLLDAGSMLEIGSAAYMPFSPAELFALGRDDGVPVFAAIATPGRALMPWSPVHAKWHFLDNGDLEIGWTRRSRGGVIWADHIDVPLAEEVEKYRVELSMDDDFEAAILMEAGVPYVIISSIQIAPLISGNVDHVAVKVRQIGLYGLSEPLAFQISL